MNEEDDIEKIMSEIEDLQDDMKETVSPREDDSMPTVPEPTEEELSDPIVNSGGPVTDTSDTQEDVEASEPSPRSQEIPHELLQEAHNETVKNGKGSETTSQQRKSEEPEEEEWLAETYAQLREVERGSVSGAVTMAVQGNITIRIRHEKTGQGVGVSFLADGIQISLNDGTELRIPLRVQRSTRLKKAS